ncbi:hypothetical protein VPHK477_0025 [Vibrio phage K477]
MPNPQLGEAVNPVPVPEGLTTQVSRQYSALCDLRRNTSILESLINSAEGNTSSCSNEEKEAIPEGLLPYSEHVAVQLGLETEKQAYLLERLERLLGVSA